MFVIVIVVLECELVYHKLSKWLKLIEACDKQRVLSPGYQRWNDLYSLCRIDMEHYLLNNDDNDNNNDNDDNDNALVAWRPRLCCSLDPLGVWISQHNGVNLPTANERSRPHVCGLH